MHVTRYSHLHVEVLRAIYRPIKVVTLQTWVGFTVPLDTIWGHVGNDLPANVMTAAKHAAFSTNHLADIDKQNNYN